MAQRGGFGVRFPGGERSHAISTQVLAQQLPGPKALDDGLRLLTREMPDSWQVPEVRYPTFPSLSFSTESAPRETPGNAHFCMWP